MARLEGQNVYGCPTCHSNESKKASIEESVSGSFAELTVRCTKCGELYVKVQPRWLAIPAIIAAAFCLFLSAFSCYEYWLVDSSHWKLPFTLSWWGQLATLIVGISLLLCTPKIIRYGDMTVWFDDSDETTSFDP